MSRAGRVGRRFYGSSPRAAPYTGYRTRGISLAETFAGMSVFPTGLGQGMALGCRLDRPGQAENRRGPWGLSKDTGSETRGIVSVGGLPTYSNFNPLKS
jgi:hypothetical protein